MRKLFMIALLALTACDAAPTAYQPKPLSFAARPVQVNVREIRVTDSYQSPLQRPHIEQDMPLTLSAAVKQWANQRLLASPNSANAGILDITITDASAIAVPLKKTDGIKGVFTDDQDTRYDLSLKVEMRLYSGAQAISDAEGNVTVTRSHTINEKATVNDRQRLLDTMVHEMMAQFDTQADTRLHQYFSAFVK